MDPGPLQHLCTLRPVDVVSTSGVMRLVTGSTPWPVLRWGDGTPGDQTGTCSGILHGTPGRGNASSLELAVDLMCCRQTATLTPITFVVALRCTDPGGPFFLGQRVTLPVFIMIWQASVPGEVTSTMDH